jgi:hypothetical protein
MKLFLSLSKPDGENHYYCSQTQPNGFMRITKYMFYPSNYGRQVRQFAVWRIFLNAEHLFWRASNSMLHFTFLTLIIRRRCTFNDQPNSYVLVSLWTHQSSMPLCLASASWSTGAPPTSFPSAYNKAIPLTGRGGLQGCEMWRNPQCLDSRLTYGSEVVSLMRRPCFTPQTDFMVFISVRGWINSRVIVRLEGIWKKLKTSPGMEPANFKPVV